MKIWSCFPLLFFVGTCYGKYADSVARDKMMPMSGAAYSNNPVPCIKKVFSNAEFMNQRTVDCDIFPGDYCSGFTAVSHDDQAIIVAFRGSDGFLQLLSEVGDSAFGDKIPSPIGGSVSEYFYNALSAVWNGGMKNDFLTLKNKYPSYNIWVTGHSLGGAMASIFSGFIVQTGLVRASSVYLYTLGQPRTGDTTYALYHDALNLAGSYRITHQEDMVPHVPPEDFDDYYHHMSEVWYDNDMTMELYVECDADESDDCSDSNFFDVSIDDHLHYFAQKVSEYGINNCTGSSSDSSKKFKKEDFKNVPHDKPKKVSRDIPRKIPRKMLKKVN